MPTKQFENGKSRLSPLLNVHDRIKLSGLLLDHTLSTLRKANTVSDIIVVSSDRRAKRIAEVHAVSFLDEHTQAGVNSAVTLANDYCLEIGADATIVVPLDLPVIKPEDIDMMCNYAKEYDKCIVITPSVRCDGTNALLRRPANLIDCFYENNSFYMHINAATKAKAKVKIFRLKRIMRDLDTVQDAKYLIKRPRSCQSLVYLGSKLQKRRR